MLFRMGRRLPHILVALLLCTQFVLAAPQQVFAKQMRFASPPPAPLQGITVHFDVIAVVKDQSVTIRTRDFPIRTDFVVRIDKAGKRAKDGPVAGEFYSQTGGEQEATFSIPEAVRGQGILAIRLDSGENYTADSWFFNRTQDGPLFRSVKVPTPSPAQAPVLTIAEVKKNTSVTVSGKNLPPNTSFSVRMGPYENFYRRYTRLASLTSAADGTINTTLTIPTALKDVENVMVRLDGGGKSVTQIFKNAAGGTAVDEKSLIKVVPCTVVNIYPIPPQLAPGEEFDVVWTVQNTAPWDWKADTINYRYNGGERVHKYQDVYGIAWEVKRGWVFDVAVDMIAPEEPGYHRTQWALVVEDTENIYCTLDITFFVHD